MPPGDDDRQRCFEEIWRAKGFDRLTREHGQGSTIFPHARDLASSQELKALPAILARTDDREWPELEIERPLAEGGMSILHLARQRSVDRQVAIKSLRVADASPSRCTELLQEGRVMGFLEHPNIVPVYMLGQQDGIPLLVMKQVEGTCFSDFIHKRAPLPGDLPDPLEWQLGILLQVCSAVQFAHSKGVLNRDLKPDNVMIGRFGEAYVVDWGLAVSLDESNAGRMPLASEARSLAGTPLYMAPEMTAVEGHKLQVTTDVYLLGGMLHEILTGTPPHEADSIFEAMLKAQRSEPFSYDPSVPEELAAICHRAMNVDPARRHPTVEAFARDLSAFLRHQSSLRLTDQARTRLAALREVLGRCREPGDKERQQIFRLFGESRFGFLQALDAWQDNRQAHEGLKASLELMAELELQRGEHAAAALLLAELPEADPQLVRRLEEASSRQVERLQKLQQLQRETDLSLGARARGRIMLLFGLTYGLSPAVVEVVNRLWPGSFGSLRAIGLNLFFVGVIMGLFLWMRRSLLGNEANRRVFWTAMLVPLLLLLNVIKNTQHSPTDIEITQQDMLLFFSVLAILPIHVDRRLFWAPLAFVAALGGALLLPRYTAYIFAAGNVIALGLCALVWSRAPGQRGARNNG